MSIARSATKRKICDNVDGKGDYFDLLSCQDEVINRFFSFLDPKDRMGMRLNKRLNKIEAESVYFMQRVELKQRDVDDINNVIIKNLFYPFEFISRIAHNTSIGELKIEFPVSIEVARKFYNIIKEFKCIREILICYWRGGDANDSMIDFLDLSRRCKFLNFNNRNIINIINISAENLHDMYKVIVDDSTSLHYFKINTLKSETVETFLNLIGISYSNGRVSSNRNIQAYKSYHDLDRKHHVNIVDGFTRIICVGCPYGGWNDSTSIEITFHKNQEALNRFKYNTSLMEKKCTGDDRDFFDLLGCPDEVIEQFFAFLDPRERVRMRMNKRLSNIESKSKCYLEKVHFSPFIYKTVRIQNRDYHLDLINRIARNTSIGQLSIFFPDSIELGNKFCNIIKEFRCIREISIRYPKKNKAKEIITDSFLLDLSRRCEFLNLTFRTYFSPEILHKLYRSMIDGCARLRCVRLPYINKDILDGFLNSLGIAFDNGRVICNRNIEAYEHHSDHMDGEYYVNIFDGFIRITFGVLEYEDEDDEYEDFEIELLKNQEALNRAKEKAYCKEHAANYKWERIRMDVYSE